MSSTGDQNHEHTWMVYHSTNYTGTRVVERWYRRCRCGAEQDIDPNTIEWWDEKQQRYIPHKET